MDFIFELIYAALALIVVLTVHEASHASMAYYLGDPTAKIRGRMTLNPIKHLDVMGSLVFLITKKIGWAKPVPVNPSNFRHPIRDNALTSFAGPLSNFLLAFLIAIPLRYLGDAIPDLLAAFLWTIFHASIYIGIFNLFPIPPLDGANVIGIFVPRKYVRGYARFLMNGAKYFIAILLVDIFVISGIFGVSFIGRLMGVLHEIVATVLLLGM